MEKEKKLETPDVCKDCLHCHICRYIDQVSKTISDINEINECDFVSVTFTCKYKERNTPTIVPRLKSGDTTIGDINMPNVDINYCKYTTSPVTDVNHQNFVYRTSSDGIPTRQELADHIVERELMDQKIDRIDLNPAPKDLSTHIAEAAEQIRQMNESKQDETARLAEELRSRLNGSHPELGENNTPIITKKIIQDELERMGGTGTEDLATSKIDGVDFSGISTEDNMGAMHPVKTTIRVKGN